MAAMTNPATQPGAEPLDGDNLTAPQAELILAVFASNPDEVLEEAQELFQAAGYPDAESMVDELLTYLSNSAGEEEDTDKSEEDTETEEAA